MSSLDMLMGSAPRITRELFNEPSIFRILVMCSELTLEPAPDFIRLFFKSVIVSIINFVRTDSDASPVFATTGWMRRTMSFNADGSSCRSWGPESEIVSIARYQLQGKHTFNNL